MSKTYYTGFYPDEDAAGAKGSAAFLQFTAELTIYKRTLVAPSTPTGGEYNFETSLLTTPTEWSSTIPEGADPIWVSYARLTTYDRKSTVTSITWSAPVELFKTTEAPITIRLTNPTVIVPSDSNGDNQNVVNSGTDIYVYEGQNLLIYDALGASEGKWKINNRTATNVTLGSIMVDTYDFARVNSIAGMTDDSGSVLYTITGFSSSGKSFTVEALQDFTRLRGSVIDVTPPSAPTGLVLSSSVVTLEGGDTTGKLLATWNANTETDLSWYEVEIKEGSGTYIGYQTSSTRYEWNVKTNQSYTVRVRAIDKNDNRSTYSTEVAHTTVKDAVPPSVPTNIVAVAAFKTVFLSWTNPSDNDLAFVEVWRNTTNNSATATKIGTVRAANGTIGNFSDSSSLVNGTLYYYWLKAVDTSDNVSTSFSALTTSTLSSVVITGIAGQFSCTTTSLSVGQVIIISGTFGGTGSITGYANPKTYVISATNGSTTFTLVNTDGTALVTTAGTPTGLTYTKHQSAAVPAAIGTQDIVAGSITADKIRTGAITADIIAVPATGGLNSSIQVGATGVTLGTVTTNAQDPAARVNANTTTIDPGKILISGSTTLSNWRNGTDLTKIEGGSIAANTISANKLTIGTRGIDITGIQFQAQVNTSGVPTNIVEWTAGKIIYTNDTGGVVSLDITAGTATWTSGVLYIYWTKGGTTLSSDTSTGNAYGTDKIVLATYSGGVGLVVNYGRTIIDGSQITTGTVDANRLKADSAIVNNIQVGGSNFTINGTAQGTGKGTLTVNDGTVNLIKLGYLDASTVGFQLRNGSNELILSSSTTASSINNSAISIASNGTLSGGGGGQVTITGLGYTGALDATKGAVIGTNLTGVFTEAEFNNRFTANTISGTYIKNLSIDSAQIKDAAISSAKIGNLAVTNANIANLTIGTEKIQELAITKIALSQLSSNLRINNGASANILSLSFNKTIAASLLKLEASLKFEVTTGDKDIRGTIFISGGGTLTYVGTGNGNYNYAGQYVGECTYVDKLTYVCPGEYSIVGGTTKSWPLRVDGAGGGILNIPLSFISYAQSIPAGTSTYTISFTMNGGADYVDILSESSFTVREEKR